MGHSCSKLQICVCKHTAEFRQYKHNTTNNVKLKTFECWIPQGNFLQIIQTHPDTEGNMQLPFTFSFFNRFFLVMSACCLWLGPLPFPCTPDWLKILPALTSLVPCLPFLFMKPKRLSRPSLITAAEMRDNLLPSGRDRSNPAPWKSFKMQKSSFWITASSTFSLFHPAWPPTGSPFFYYIKHKLLAFILRVFLDSNNWSKCPTHQLKTQVMMPNNCVQNLLRKK